MKGNILKIFKMVWLIIAFCLVGCTSVSNQSPDEMVRQAVQRNILRDNQYNLSGQLNVHLEKKMDAEESEVEKIEEYSIKSDSKNLESLSSTELKSKNEKKVSKHSSQKNQPTEKSVDVSKDNNTEKNVDLAVELINIYMDQSSIYFTGAVDLPNGKIEIIPELRHQARNIYSSSKFPLQLDLKKKQLIVDTGSYRPYLNLYFKSVEFDKISEKPYLGWNIPSKYYDNSSVKSIVRALPKSIDDVLASYAKEDFIMMDMDEGGRKIGARYRIRVNSNAQKNKIALKVMLSSIKQQLKLDDSNDNNTSEDSILKNYDVLNKLIETLENDIENEETKVEKKPTTFTQSSDFYLDNKGRIIGLKEFNKINSKLLKSHFIVNLWLQFNYTPQPNFIIKSTPLNTQYFDNIKDFLLTDH